MLEIVALIISALAIATYVRLAITGDARAFNWMNAIGWPILIVSVQHRAWPAAMLNLFFILVGTLGVIVAWRKRRAERKFQTILRFELAKMDPAVIASIGQTGGVTAQNVNAQWN